MIWRWLSLTAAGLVVFTGALAAGGDLGTYTAWVHRTMAVSVVGGFLVLWAAWTWRDQRPGRGWLLVVMLLGVAMRLSAVSASWELSDDAARYHWDGKVVAHGLNPYLYAPDAPEVARFRIHAIDDRINHPWNRTCYPPLAQAVFAAGYVLSPGRLTGLQLLGLLGEVCAWLLLARELSRRRLSWGWLLLMIWAPILVFQGYLPGHVDLFNLPLVTLLILAVMSGHGRRAGLYLALCCLVKPLPLLWLPAMARALGARKTAALLMVFGAVTVVAYLPFWNAGWTLFSSTWLMATDWSFNGSIGAFFEAILPHRIAHLLSGSLVIALVLLAAGKIRDFLAAALLAQVAFVALTPTLFPWYLTGMYPLLVLRPQPALLTLGVLAPLSDEVVVAYHATGAWRSALWARFAQYVPFYGALVWQWCAARAGRRSPTG